MKMIVPITVNDAVLTSSNIAETDYAAWNSGTTYAVNARVIVTATHSVYQSIQSGNTNNDPVTDSALETPTWWVRVGATNRWKAFDSVIQDRAVRSGGISYELDVSSRADGIALFNLDATSVRVRVDDPSNLRRNILTSTNDLNHASWTKTITTYIGAVVDPDGGTNAQSFNFTSAFSSIAQTLTSFSGELTMTVWVRSDNITGVTVFINGSNFSLPVSDEWTSIQVTTTVTSATVFGLRTLSGTGILEIYHPQLESGDSPTDYQEIDSGGLWSSISYDTTRELQDYSDIDDYWSYFFDPIVKIDSVVFENVPAFTGTTVLIDVQSDEVAKVGEIALGQGLFLGDIHAGASVGIQDYSRKDRDTFGNVTAIERAYSDTMDLNFSFDATRIATLRRELAGRRAKGTVFHGGEGNEQFGLLAYGFYKDINFPIVTKNLCVASLEIEGLT